MGLLQHSALVMVCEYHNMPVLVGTWYRGGKQADVNLVLEVLLLHTVYCDTILLLRKRET